MKSAPFWAILVAHMGQNYGYETLMTELPTFMKQVLHFNIKAVSTRTRVRVIRLGVDGSKGGGIAFFFLAST